MMEDPQAQLARLYIEEYLRTKFHNEDLTRFTGRTSPAIDGVTG
jgi:hypothetical protein